MSKPVASSGWVLKSTPKEVFVCVCGHTQDIQRRTKQVRCKGCHKAFVRSDEDQNKESE